jgi:membrane fusion protein, multidrug efflux system
MNKLLRILLPLLVIGVLAAGVIYRIRGNAEAATASGGATGDSIAAIATSASDEFATLPIAVEGVPVVKDELVMVVRAEGQAMAERQAVVRAQVAGRVLAVRVRESTAVGNNAVLVVIDPTQYQLNLDEANARLAQAQRQYEELTLGDDRLTDAAIRESRAQAARSKAGLDQFEIAVRKAELELERTQVTAPFAGRVANLRVVSGQNVQAGDEVLTMIDLDPIRVEVGVLESGVGFLNPGRNADVVFSALPGETFRGRIETINPMVDERTRTAKVTLSIPNPGGRILPGFFAVARLDARRLPDRTLVPREAVIERDRRTLVFLFDGEGDTGTAMWQYVRTGLENGTLIEIIEDPDDSATRMLNAGEIVLTSGHYTLTHGATVRMVTDSRAAEGGRPR